ncbi:hypothetical protein M3C53_02310 [Micrococcus luteus]|nr:hypothetical protein [Micrococcus luteus]
MAIETSGAQRPTATARPYHPAPMPGVRGFLDRKRHLPFSRRRGRRGYGFSTGLVAVLCLAAFGPYVTGSIRTEQLAVYALAPLVLLSLPRLRPWAWPFLLAWGFMLFIASLGVAFPYRGVRLWDSGSLLAGADNYLLPLMVMLAVWTLVSTRATIPALRTAAGVIGFGAAINGAIAAVSTVTPLDAILRPFWGAAAAGSVVAERAATNGRLSGIFNQPAEAGLVYSLAAILVVWAFSRRRLLMYPLLALILVGGMLTVSKIFLLVGLPIAGVLLWLTQRGTARLGIIVLAAGFLAYLGSSSFFREWSGSDYLLRLLDRPEDQTVLEFYTAGRWSEGASVLEVIGFILDRSPMVGVGLAGLRVPYDAQWTETMVFGGVLGTLAIVAMLGLLLASFVRIRERSTRLMALAVWALLVGASFGLPALTANRAATLVWVVAGLLVLARHAAPKRHLAPGRHPGTR